jgi:hypothetical protein
MKTTHVVLGIVGVVVAGVAYYGLSPLFINIKADDAVPSSMHDTQVMPHDAMATSTDMNNHMMATGTTPHAMSATGDTMMQKSDTHTPAAVTGTTGHPASGTARLVTADGKSYVRYENFKTINGPDIYVYLAKDLDAHEYVSLGKVRATEGNVNYEIPAGTDLSQYPYVLTWCKTFGVLFNSAKIQ